MTADEQRNVVLDLWINTYGEDYEMRHVEQDGDEEEEEDEY